MEQSQWLNIALLTTAAGCHLRGQFLQKWLQGGIMVSCQYEAVYLSADSNFITLNSQRASNTLGSCLTITGYIGLY
jgi:hypothetical protein